MPHARRLERAAGALLLAFMLVTLAALALGWSGQPGTTAKDSRVHEHRAPRELAQTVLDGRERLVAATASFLLASAIAAALAATLYAWLQPNAQLLAGLAALGFLVSAVILLGQALLYVALWAVVVEFDHSSGAAVDAAAGNAFVLLEIVRTGWAGSLLLFVPVSLAAVNIWFLRNPAMPNVLAWLGVTGAVLLVSGWLAYLGGALIVPGGVGLIVLMAWLLATGAWLVARGSYRAALTTGARPV